MITIPKEPHCETHCPTCDLFTTKGRCSGCGTIYPFDHQKRGDLLATDLKRVLELPPRWRARAEALRDKAMSQHCHQMTALAHETRATALEEAAADLEQQLLTEKST